MNSSTAQKADSIRLHQPQLAFITQVNNSEEHKSILIKDSLNFLIYSLVTSGPESSFFQQKERIIPIENIEFIKIAKQRETGKGVLKGGVVGGFMFGVAGALLARGIDDCANTFNSDCNDVGALEGFAKGFGLGVIPGMLIGGISTTSSIKIYINGNLDRYRLQRSEIKKYFLE